MSDTHVRAFGSRRQQAHARHVVQRTRPMFRHIPRLMSHHQRSQDGHTRGSLSSLR